MTRDETVGAVSNKKDLNYSNVFPRARKSEQIVFEENKNAAFPPAQGEGA